MIYRTYFKLDYPVLDINDAQEYLSEDDMIKYLKNDNRISKSTRNNVTNIAWILQDEQSGYIELETTVELSDLELMSISNWVSGQNSDGLGEGFEQQGFANYQIDDGWGNGDEYDADSDIWVMASFDWRTNDYKFELVSK